MARSKTKTRGADLATIDVTPRGGITEKTVRHALIETGGKITLAAALLREDYSVVKRFIDRSPALQALIAVLEEGRLDQLEYTVEQAAIQDRDVSAATFMLRTKGKGRGYGDEVTVKVDAAQARKALAGVMSRLSDEALAELEAALEAEGQ